MCCIFCFFFFQAEDGIRDLVRSRGLGDVYKRQVVSVTHTTPAIEAYKRMETEKVSGAAVLDEQGRVVGNLSASNLRGIRRDQLAQLLLHVKDFLDLQQRQRHGVVHEEQLPCFVVHQGDTLSELLQAFTCNRVHRLYVVDADGAPLAVITLTDVMNFLAKLE
eukprot:TRINITY_DN1692_c0_g1_i5.p1 TRINITY_DN1692_c0_g1~~TRINITY_DN1692_c0_g1_i5.p1  ORF type:complete len:163 (-),score=36.68 TRINITY_DN1692_c0_g1_i5:128-616(-)